MAVLFDEPPRARLAAAIEADEVRLISAATVVEASGEPLLFVGDHFAQTDVTPAG